MSTRPKALTAREHQPVAGYSAGRDIAAETEPSTTGTKLDIAATDHIRPIATTTAIPTIHGRILHPLFVAELPIGTRIFFAVSM
jgi:hypothetical protein